MLPRSHRLRQRSAFDTIYRRGSRHRGKLVTVRCFQVPSPQLLSLPQGSTSDRCKDWTLPEQASSPRMAPTQIAVVVSKKVHRRAVVRNRIKRRIRSQLRHLLPFLKPGWQAIVSPHRPATPDQVPPVLDASPDRLLTELRTIFDKVGLLEMPQSQQKDF